SLTDCRVRRMMYAHESAPSTMAGMSSDWKDSSLPTVTGSKSQRMPTMYWKTKPVTKEGTAITSRETTNTVETKNPPRRIPENTPKAMPKMVSKIMAMKASLSVTGKTFRMTSVTGTPEKVVPKSRVKIPLT